MTGHAPLRRVPAGVKLAALFLLGVSVYLVSGPGPRYGLLLAAVVALACSGVSLAALASTVRGLVVFVAAVFAITALSVDVPTAAVDVVRLVTLVLFALAVTASTRYAAVLDTFDRLLAPLRHVGLRPERISLTLALTVRFVPEIRSRYAEIREAQYARGLASRPRAVLVPLLVRTLTDAEDIADALDARGYESD